MPAHRPNPAFPLIDHPPSTITQQQSEARRAEAGMAGMGALTSHSPWATSRACLWPGMELSSSLSFSSLALSGQLCLGLEVKQNLCPKRNHLCVKMKMKTGRTGDRGDHPSVTSVSQKDCFGSCPGGRSDRTRGRNDCRRRKRGVQHDPGGFG